MRRSAKARSFLPMPCLRISGDTPTARIYPPRAKTGSGVKIMKPTGSSPIVQTNACFSAIYFKKSIRSFSVIQGSEDAVMASQVRTCVRFIGPILRARSVIMIPFRIPPQSFEDRFSQASGIFAAARVVDDVVGVSAFLLERHLARNSGQGLFPGELIAGNETLDLLF